MTMNTDKWTVGKARTIFAQLTRVANDMLEAAPAADAAGSAGPQEVVDAIEVIVDQLEEVQAAIPAEPSMEDVEAPVEEAPVEEPPVEEEEPKLAKQVRELQAKLEEAELEKVAKEYGSLFDEPKVQQAKYEGVLNSSHDSKYCIAQIEAIQQFKETTGVSSYKPAKTTSNWVMPRTKVAKQSSEMMSL